MSIIVRFILDYNPFAITAASCNVSGFIPIHKPLIPLRYDPPFVLRIELDTEYVFQIRFSWTLREGWYRSDQSQAVLRKTQILSRTGTFFE